MREKYFANLGEAVRAMDYDPNSAKAYVERRGPHAASFEEEIPLEEGAAYVDAVADFYPDEAIVKSAELTSDSAQAEPVALIPATQMCEQRGDYIDQNDADLMKFYANQAQDISQQEVPTIAPSNEGEENGKLSSLVVPAGLAYAAYQFLPPQALLAVGAYFLWSKMNGNKS